MSGEGRRSGLRMALVILVLVVVVMLLLTPPVQNLVSEFLSSAFQERAPRSVRYQVQRSLTVDANGGRVNNFTLDAPVPGDIQGDGASLQEVTPLSVLPTVTPVTRHGDPWLVWEHGPLTDHQTYHVELVYEVRVETRSWDIGAAASGVVGDVPADLREAYLRDEWKMYVDDARIQQKAWQIVGDEENVCTVLRLIYDWMVANVDYPTATQGGDPSSSLETLSSMMGDCDDQAILFCSLARAAGVPAWLQLGALYDRSRDSWTGHGWVQAYVPLLEGGSEVVTIDTVNRDFMLWMPNRLAEYTDDGNGDHLRDYYYSFTYTYDPGSYPPGEGPVYLESYASLLYEESEEKVPVGSAFQALEMWAKEQA